MFWERNRERGEEREKKNRQTTRTHDHRSRMPRISEKRREDVEERERNQERERHPTDVYASLFVLYHSHSLLSSCSHTLVA